jgi:manganese/zinc/iron transport system permease protein
MLLSQDLPILLTLLSAAVTAILAGSLLLPKGQIMISEAASHAVLPGLILGFVLSGTHGWEVLLGAVLVIALFVAGVGWLRTRHSFGRGVEIAALFPIFFGIGIIALSLSGLEDTGMIDVDHILFGSLELLLWFEVAAWPDLLRAEVWSSAPPQMMASLASFSLSLALCLLAYPLFNRSLMDPEHFALKTPVAAFAVKVLETLVIAMAAAACLRAAGVVVAIALFSAPAIAGWAFARTLWQVWVGAIAVAVLGIVLTYGTSMVAVQLLNVEPRLSGILALWVVVLAVLAAPVAKRLKRARPMP